MKSSVRIGVYQEGFSKIELRRATKTGYVSAWLLSRDGTKRLPLSTGTNSTNAVEILDRARKFLRHVKRNAAN